MSDSDRCTVEDCRIRGQHWASCPAVGADCGCACHTGGLERPCDVDGGCHAQHDDSCPGCLPHLANTDLGWTVCSRCGGWVTMAVVEAADLVAHIRACIDGTGTIVAEPDSGGGGASIRKRPDPPVPINADAVDDADRIYVELRTAVAVAAEVLGLHGPDAQPGWYTTDDAGVPALAGLPPGSGGREAAPYATWLLRHLDDVLGTEVAADLVGKDALTGIVRSASRRWTRETGETLIAGVPCPECLEASVYRKPIAEVGAPLIAHCRGCLAVWSGPDEDKVRAVIEAVRADRDQQRRDDAVDLAEDARRAARETAA